MSESIKGMVGKNYTFEEIFSEMRTVDEMTEDEVRSALKAYRELWSWLPTEVQYWGSKIGERIRVAERQGITKDGHYSGFTVEIKEHVITGYERVYDQVRKKFFIQKNSSIVPQNNIIDFAFISEEVEDETP